MTRPTLSPRRLGAVAATVALAALGAAGCGSSSSSGGDTDPASAVAVTAPLYFEAVVNPKGDVKANLDAVAKKVLRTSDPGKKLQALIDQAGNKNHISYADDIKPWLGDRVGVGITSLANTKNPEVVVAAASKDDGAARKAVERIEKGDKVTTAKYKDVGYRVDATEKSVTGVTGGLLMFSETEAGFRHAVDAIQGDSLADTKLLKDARAKVAADRIGFLYADPNGIFDAVTAAAGPTGAQLAPLRSTILGTDLKSIAAALVVDKDAIRVDGAALGHKGTDSGANIAADTLAGMPQGSLLGAGLGDIGKTLNGLLTRLGSTGAIVGADADTILRQVKAQTGIDVRKDLLDWMGAGGIFVRGDSLSTLGGALTVESKDPAATRTGIAHIARLLARQGAKVKSVKVAGADVAKALQISKAPKLELVLAAGGKRFAAAIGRDAAAEALKPTGKLGDDQAFQDAAGKLRNGVRPAFFLDFPSVVKLIGEAAGSDASFAKAKPYLDAFTQVVAGTKAESDAARLQLVVGVK